MPAPRRLVLLPSGATPDAPAERILGELDAVKVHEAIRVEAGKHPGRVVAAEWQKDGKWIRWLTCWR